MKSYKTINETVGYVTAEEPTNTDPNVLVGGSKNVLIDQQRKVRTRNGNTRFGATDESSNKITGAVTWGNSTGNQLEVRVKNGALEVYIDSENEHIEIYNGLSTTSKTRFTTWWDDTQSLDLLLFVDSSDKIFAWSGAIAVVDSITGTTITKTGTDTFGQARFLTSSGTLVNTRTGTEYAYTGGVGTTTLTGISDTTGIVAGDILVQKVTVNDNEPADGRSNHTIFIYDNQLCIGSNEDEEAYISANDDYTDFTFSSPRVPGEGAILTLDDPARGFEELEGTLIVFAGRSSVYAVAPAEITVGSTLTETLQVKKYVTGLNQSAQNQDVIQKIGSSLLYLSFEPAVREIPSPSVLQAGGEPRTLSNPINPDIRSETWTDATAIWYDNGYHLSAPTTGRVYILQYREDADGKLRRFWQAPQTMFINVFTAYGDDLHGHSSVIGQTYKLFDPLAFSDLVYNSDTETDEKVPIQCIANFSYRNYDDRVNLKNFDEYFIEGEISPSTKVNQTLFFDFGGKEAALEFVIDGSDNDILLETLDNISLGQQPLAQQSLGGSLAVPTSTAKFRVIFEQAKIDFVEMQDRYETNSVDTYWAIISRGANAQLSRRQNITIKK